MVKLSANGLYQTIGEKIICSNFSITIKPNDFIVITGKSGSGKTSLLNVLGLLDTPDKGSIAYNNTVLRKKKDIQFARRNIIGYIFQNNLLIDEKTVKENFSLILSKKNSIESYVKALKKVGLSEIFLDQKVLSLSAGQQQKVALARTLLKNNEIIFADEPTGNLDEENALLIIKVLKEWSLEKDNSVVLVTHNKDFIEFSTKHIQLA